ncbi:hypothetical protein [Eremococcus coleocola]|uniref:Uncharacterized protein n=1 Tax=Eremococcus coleocola ACS-139-V-Col8 TaxID=908337 RepID=E4KPA0_9LACT|nr:hypothetical protein [Eremococcus coleocola]EFR30976.1 hypothetical protein HMPREF9257_1387 [Eremococcus coleocola ACS-139-V-Col8]
MLVSKNRSELTESDQTIINHYHDSIESYNYLQDLVASVKELDK